MEIIGHGVDIIELVSINRLLERSGERFALRCFTSQERAACKNNVNRAQYLAGRLAAKEAVLKALGTGWSQNTSLLDIEVLRLASGQPTIQLHSRCKEIASELRISTWLISISHSTNYSVASVIAVGHKDNPLNH